MTKTNNITEQATLSPEEYLKEYGVNVVKELGEAMAERNNAPEYPTGFDYLDTVLDGGLRTGLYVVGAISSLGKTTFCLQIMDYIAQEHDVLIFSLEMPRSDLVAKSISRKTYDIATREKHRYRPDNASTTTEILKGWIEDETKSSLYCEALEEYNTSHSYERKISGTDETRTFTHVYICEASESITCETIDKTIEAHINATGNNPVVLVDYLQLIAPKKDARCTTDRQIVTDNIKALAHIRTKYKIPVVVISSINRSNYNNDISFEAFKDSGEIEYCADCVIGLQRKKADDPNDNADGTRDIQAKILKQRNGLSNIDIDFVFTPKYNHFDIQDKSKRDNNARHDVKNRKIAKSF